MAILKFSASAVAVQIAHARACKTFLPNWNGPVDRPALILIVGNGVHLRSNGIDGTTTRIVTTEQADPSFAFADGMNPYRHNRAGRSLLRLRRWHEPVSGHRLDGAAPHGVS